MSYYANQEPRPFEPHYGTRMSNAEAVLLCRYAKAACPQQAFDQYTPDAWFDLLSDLRFEDCKMAIKCVVQRQPFVAPAEIRDEVKRVRLRRFSEFGPMPDPPLEIGAQGSDEYRRWVAETMRAIGDGTAVPGPNPASLTTRPERTKLGLAGKSLAEDNADAKRRARADLDAAKRKLQEERPTHPTPLPPLCEHDPEKETS